MIPIKLSLRNFMCYRDDVPPIRFKGFHIACLCGDNGNGKSALVDALTWALWGKSRARHADELVHVGKNDMEVELEFAVAKQVYRAIRKHMRSSSFRPGQTILELQMATDGAFKSRTGNSIAETQREIEDVLRLDYETFINSALFLQGHSNEFSIKQPSKRKQVLTDILGFYIYDQLQEQARNSAKEREMEAKRLNSNIADISEQLSLRQQCHDELSRVEQEVSIVQDKRETQEARVNQLRREKESLENKQQHLTELKTRLEKARNQLAYWEQKSTEYRSKVERCEELTAQKAAIEEGYAQLLEMRELGDKLNKRLSRLLDLQEHINELDKVIEAAKRELVTEQKVIQNQILEHEAQLARLPALEKELDEIRYSLVEIGKAQERIGAKREQNQELLSQIHHSESVCAQFVEEVRTLEEKIALLAQSGAQCPLCQSELGMEGRERLQTKLRAEKETKTEALQAKEQELEQKRLEYQAANSHLIRKEQSVNKERIDRESQAGTLKNRINEINRADTEMSQKRAALKEIAGSLAKRDYAPNEQQVLAKLKEEQGELGYDRERHQWVRERLEKLQKYEEEKRELEEANRLRDREKVALADAEQTISSLYSDVNEYVDQRCKLEAELAALPDIARKLVETEQSYQALVNNWRSSYDRLTQLRMKLHQYDELEHKRNSCEKLRHQALDEEQIYRELAEAFGKKGIQALLIERSLPEIETEANRLLGKMTDNRLTLRLETQRETKKGESIETLDIKIADELGTRSYEMYSGGEAFRIDMALRIALSKLLVMRAGASLSTLIIDEGFGTQDSSGREKLVETINSIQDDFDKILVITHLEELRDAFPVRINVIKTAGGSTISFD
jgi:exonuclease SbcC